MAITDSCCPALRRARHGIGPALVALLLAGCVQGVDEEGAVRRGDQAWARGDREEALAEYRLALRQGSEDAQVLTRIAHAYAELDQVDEAREYYERAVRRDSAYVDQAVSDLVRLARSAEARDDRFGLASAMEAANRLRPGLGASELALPMARHYSRNGDYGRALPFYQKAMASAEPDSTPEVLFEAALAYEQVGDCERALLFYDQYREIIPEARRSEVNWRIGECSFRRARQVREEGDVEEALRLVQTTIAIGEPRSRLAQAYFEQAEILAEQGECEAAVEAYRQVREVDPAGVGPLVNRAQERIDQIRFGGDPFGGRSRATGAC